jgi:DNA polymerase II large subunit
MMGGTRSSCSAELESYFAELARGLDACMDVARRARAKGLDPETEVEIPIAVDLAERVESLVGPPGIAERIREVSEGRTREEAALHIAREIVRTIPFPTKEKALDQAIRTGLAVLTEGVLVAPLEGVSEVKIKQNPDGTSYADVFFSGPIRAAGGTAQALSVLIADVVRRELRLGAYRATDKQVERYKEEVRLYNSIVHLQFLPSPEEIDLIARGCPVCIDGDGTEDSEVSGNRDVLNVETNRVRSGACLVMAEGMSLKAPKIQKHVHRLGVDGWEFIDALIERGKGAKAKGGAAAPAGAAGGTADGAADGAMDGAADDAADDADGRADDEGPPEPDEDLEGLEEDELDPAVIKEMESARPLVVEANAKYMNDLIAGRPVLAHPSMPGGFRLRYGRTRATGLAAVALSPATMWALDRFVAIGTQLKIERPGKAGAITPCESIEGPIALLRNGDLVEVDTVERAKEHASAVVRFYDVGEILVPFGEFAENNHRLVPGAFAAEWWEEEVRAADPEGRAWDVGRAPPTLEQAVELSRAIGVPLHPDHNLFWHDMTPEEISALSRLVAERGRFADDGSLELPLAAVDDATKDMLCRLGALHTVRGDNLRFGRHSAALVLCLGLERTDGRPRRRRQARADRFDNPLALVSYLSNVQVVARSPTRIGARIGRPEKAKERRMKPPPHVLFPVGPTGGNQRLVNEAVKSGRIEVEIGNRRCPACGAKTPLAMCRCGAHTRPVDEPSKQVVNLGKLLSEARARLGETSLPQIKAVKGMVSKLKVPEPLEKGILRARNGVYVFKDGTIRYDMTDVPLTHFRPQEVGLPIARAREMGYTHDIGGAPLERPDQMLELRPQDIVLPVVAGEYLVRTAKFLDEMLVRLYGLEAHYRAEEPKDLVGHLAIGLAPHTSAGVLCRIVGFSFATGCYAHPFFHAAKRRNCDGDEDCVMLLLDGLINFSRRYLPEGRGGLMDAPLVLSSRIDPNEIDKEAQNIDVMSRYPLELYRAAARGAHPKEVDRLVDTVGHRIGTPGQYEGLAFTHEVKDINSGVRMSAYKVLGKMTAKMDAQFELGSKIRAVDIRDEAKKVIETHFLPDLQGNLNAFSKQVVRCSRCNVRFRRMPVRGACPTCGSELTLTVHEASVRKYLEVTKKLIERYGVDEYTKQRVELLEQQIQSVFKNDKVQQCDITGYGEST